MLKRPTVFVIGAGAGVDIGMPVGATLSADIGEKLDLRYGETDEGHGRISGHPGIEAALRRYAQAANVNYNDFRSAGTMIKTGAPYAGSIDNFMNSHRDNERLAVCAKLGIVHTILDYERNSALYREKSVPNSFRDDDRVKKSWLGDLIRMLVDEVAAADMKHIFNNFCIINFNYDRCIEQFLFHAIQEWSQRGEGVVAPLFSRLNIFHPYGSVGRLPWQVSEKKPRVEFGGSSFGEDDLTVLIDQMKTYHESVEEGDELFKMREELWKAQQVIFLGFHFHKQNMDLLVVPDDARPRPPWSYATVMGRPAAAVNAIKTAISKTLRNQQEGKFIETVDGDCKKLFHEFRSTWMA
jgi:hypothetical protein